MELGVLAALVASLIWGFAPAIIKLGVSEDTSAVVFNTLRLIAAIPVTALIIVVLHEQLIVPSNIIGWIAVFAAGTIGPGIGDVAYIYAIREVGGGKAVTIGYTYILISQFLALLFFGEELAWNLITGSVLAIIGIWLVAREAKNKSYNVKGIMASCVSAVAWGFGSIANKYALTYTNPLSLALLRMIFLLVILLAFTWRQLGNTNKKAIYASIFTGATSYGIAMPLFLYALDVIGVSVTVLITALTPALGRITTRILTKEEISLHGIIGTIVIILGLIIGTST